MTAGRRRAVGAGAILVAIVSAAIAMALAAGGGPSAPQSPRAALPPGGDADHDGVPNGRDLQPHVRGARAPRLPVSRAPRLPRPDCARKGITRARGREGTCVDAAGHRILVVDRASTLRLRELDMAIRPPVVRRSIGTGAERTQTRGAFVVLSATVHNRLHTAAQLRPEQISLVLGRHTVGVASVPDSALPTSFQRRPTIRAGGTRSGTLLFAIPRRWVHHLDTDGNVVVVQFSDADYASAYRTVGFIRTYR